MLKKHYNKFIFSSICVSFFTLFSRILGYIRDIILTSWVGIGGISDAYFLSTKFPSLFRKVISDGTTNNILIPMLKDMKLNNKNESQFLFKLMIKFIKNISLIVIFLLFIVKYYAQFIFINLSPVSKDYFVKFSYFMIPSLLFMGISSIWMSVLNFNRKFIICSISTVICNLSVILMLLIGCKLNFSVLFIGFAILFGNIIQLIWIIFNIYRCKLVGFDKGNDLKQDNNFKKNNYQSEMFNFRKKFLDISFSSGITQIMIMFSSWFASFLPAGNISYLAYADRVMQVPISIIGIIFSTTFLSYLTQHIKENHIEKAKQMYNQTWNYGLLLSSLITLVIFLFSNQICRLLFLHGKTTLVDVNNISLYLRIYILSVPVYTLSKIMNAVFFARGDTKTPMKAATMQCVSNFILIPILFRFGSVGISVSFLISACIYGLYLGRYIEI